MRVHYSKRFENRFRRLPHAHKKAAVEVIDAFLDNPHASSLGNHALRGAMAGTQSIEVDNDLRIIFTVKGDYDEVTFLNIGTHIEVYRK